MQRERRGGGAKTRDRKTISNSCTVLGCTVGWTRDEGGGGGDDETLFVAMLAMLVVMMLMTMMKLYALKG